MNRLHFYLHRNLLLYSISTNSWEQRKLGEVGSVSMCRRIFKEQTSESGDIPFYKIGTFGGQADAFISEELFAEYRSKYPYPKEGDILISASGSIGRTVEFTGGNEYFQDSNIVWLSHDDRLDNTFLKYFYSVVKWAGIEGSTIKRLYNDNILHTVISMPSVAEQKKIGAFFKELDHLITLHQRKLDRLKNIKKSMLDKMFPKDGEVVPEIRFKGFTDAWEQRKLINYLEVSSKKNIDGAYRKEDVLSVSGDYGIVNQIEFQGRSFAGVSVAQYGVVDTGDVVYTKSPLKFNPYGIIKTNIGKAGIVSTLYAVYKPLDNVYSEFVQIYFEQDARMNNYMHPLVNKGAKNDMKVSNENALKGKVCFPSMDEQIKISEYFANLDNLITLHQRKSQYYIRRIRKECLMI